MSGLTDAHRAFLQLVMAKHAVEASREAPELLEACKERFAGSRALSVASCVLELNDHLQEIKFKIALVGSDCDSLKYYVFANKGVVSDEVRKPSGLALFQEILKQILNPDECGERGSVARSSIKVLQSNTKRIPEFDMLVRHKWLQASPSTEQVFLGPRGVAELDVESRNSLPTCAFCHEIVVAGICDGLEWKHAWCTPSALAGAASASASAGASAGAGARAGAGTGAGAGAGSTPATRFGRLPSRHDFTPPDCDTSASADMSGRPSASGRPMRQPIPEIGAVPISALRTRR